MQLGATILLVTSIPIVRLIPPLHLQILIAQLRTTDVLLQFLPPCLFPANFPDPCACSLVSMPSHELASWSLSSIIPPEYNVLVSYNCFVGPIRSLAGWSTRGRR